MANIIRAEIVGTRMAENSSFVGTVNSTSYSVLIFYDNGFCELVEGYADEIQHLLPFLSPRVDYNQLVSILTQFEEKIKQDVTSIVRQAIFANDNPIPVGLTGKRDTEAIRILETAGFKTEIDCAVLDSNHGTVMQCTRKENDPMTVVLKIKYDIPDVKELSLNYLHFLNPRMI